MLSFTKANVAASVALAALVVSSSPALSGATTEWTQMRSDFMPFECCKA
jgi:hypothetical protein